MNLYSPLKIKLPIRCYSADTHAGTRGRNCPITTFSESKRFLRFFSNGPINWSQPVQNFKTLLTK